MAKNLIFTCHATWKIEGRDTVIKHRKILAPNLLYIIVVEHVRHVH